MVVQPSGHKSFHMRLWFRGKGYNITLGPWLDALATGTAPVLGAPLTLADARVLAAQCLRQVKGGKHPNTLKQRAVDENSVQAIADEYMAREGSKLRTAIQRKYDLDLVCASFGSRPIADIKISDIVRLRDKLEFRERPKGSQSRFDIVANARGVACKQDGRLPAADHSETYKRVDAPVASIVR